MPDTLTAGLNTLKLYNGGSQPHQALLARLRDNVTYDQLLVAFKKGLTAGMPMVTLAGGPNTVMPRQSQEVILNLEPGRYIALSFDNDSQGISDVQHGMFKILTVKGPTRINQINLIHTDAQIDLRDFSFTLPQTMPKSELQVVVNNQGTHPHELALLKLLPGKTPQAAREYLIAPYGAAPFEQTGGSAAIAPGQSTWIKLALQPGNYLAVCQLSDPGNSRSHLEMGMLTSFKVQE